MIKLNLKCPECKGFLVPVNNHTECSRCNYITRNIFPDDPINRKRQSPFMGGDKKKMEEIKPVKAVTIPDGKHTGVIEDVKKREYTDKNGETFAYVDLHISVKDIEGDPVIKNGETFAYVDLHVSVKDIEGDPVIRYGMPVSPSMNGKLMKTASEFVKIEEGSGIDPETVFKDKGVSFETQNETTDRGTFARILEGSIKSL